jgi:uncharacterized protein (TIGR03067 family)
MRSRWLLVLSVGLMSGADDGRLVSSDAVKLHGTWTVVELQAGCVFHVKFPHKDFPEWEVVCRGDLVELRARFANQPEVRLVYSYRLDPTQRPKAIDLINLSGVHPGVYELDGNRLRVTYNWPGMDRPQNLDDENTMTRIVLQRKKP